MVRQFISEQRLLGKINAELSLDHSCRGYTVSSLMRVDIDQTGCNWAVAAMSGPLSSRGTDSSSAYKIIETFKAQYNFAG